ncbi:MAG: vitamin K epoxide reductase family protein [Candidatus Woesearchaeota archaeon]
MVWIYAVIGIIVSIYVMYVEKKLKHNAKYKAICDINSKIFCTKVILDRSAYLVFGLHNSIIGILYYITVIIASFYANFILIVVISIPAIMMTIYLMIVTLIRIRKICIMCSITHILNIIIFIIAVYGL